MEMLILDGSSLTIEQVARVAERDEPVALAPAAIERMQRPRVVVERPADGEAPGCAKISIVFFQKSSPIPLNNLPQFPYF